MRSGANQGSIHAKRHRHTRSHHGFSAPDIGRNLSTFDNLLQRCMMGSVEG